VLAADRKRIVHDAYYGDLVLADFRTGEKLLELYPVTRPRTNYRLAIAPDNRTLAVIRRANQDQSKKLPSDIELWDLDKRKKIGQVNQVLDLQAQLLFWSNSQQLQVWHGGQVTVWDVTTKKRLSQRATTRGAPYFPVLADGKRFFNTGYDPVSHRQRLELVSLADDKVLQRWDCFESQISTMALSPDESLLAVATPEGPVVLVDLRGVKK
jgi:WD40 repeat protein